MLIKVFYYREVALSFNFLEFKKIYLNIIPLVRINTILYNV